MRRLLPDDLRGQVAGILLLGLALSQAMAAMLYMVLLPQWQKIQRPGMAATRVSMVVRLLESVPQSERPAFAQLWDDEGFRVIYTPASGHATEDGHTPANGGLIDSGRVAGTPDDALRAQVASVLHRSIDGIEVLSTGRVGAASLKQIRVALRGGGRIEVATPVGPESRLGYLEEIAVVAFLLFATGSLWAWLTWTVNRPLTRFSYAAERVGLDVHAPALPEEGPAQLKRATRAFNEMQVRLQRFLSDRTRMLGAISHDLRTPLTRLRLRVETDRAADEKSKMLSDIEVMEAMLTSTLSFVRGVDEVEAAELVELDSVLQTVCDLVSDLGGDVTYAGSGRHRFRCKPQSIMRALTNIVANAAKYGSSAVVSLERRTDEGFIIEIQDNGPGIPDAEKARVFEPFYRTASAHEADSQGMGLGLSIARSIILAHGGTIDLLDRSPAGLCVRIFLPEASDRQTGGR